MNKIYIYPGEDEVFQFLFEDCERSANAVVYNNILVNTFVSGVWRFLYKHPSIQFYSYPILSYLTAPFIKLHTGGNGYLFTNISIRYFSLQRLIKLKQTGARLFLFFLDSSSAVNSRIAMNIIQKVEFDRIYTFDKSDATEFGFIHRDTFYSEIKFPNSISSYDGVYVGSDKGRYDSLKRIYEKLNNCNLFFLINGVANLQNRIEGIIYDHFISYKDYLSIVNDSNCIIDVVTDYQNGLSLRCYEAVVLNKKLITTNASILNFKYYNPNYIKYMKDPEDIDEGFIKERIEVDYKYENDFSPIHLIDELLSYC